VYLKKLLCHVILRNKQFLIILMIK